MQRASQERSASVRATRPTPPAGRSVVAVHLFDEPELPAAPEVDMACLDDDLLRGAQQQSLEIAIRQRIETRLQGRVRNLKVRAYGDVVILEGQCATYYSKQLAQHAAMGVLEDEHLENAIVVSVAK